ncbi:MAG: iron ABC transporter permease [Spirochaetales bacterium]
MKTTSPSLIHRLRLKDWTPYLVFTIPLVFLSLFMFWPLLSTFLRAFMGPGFEMRYGTFTLENFHKFYTSSLYYRSLRNSFIVSVSVVFFTLLIGIPMGYMVARVKLPFKNLILALGILPIILPSFVGAFSWIILLGRQGVVRKVLNPVLEWFGISLPPVTGMFGMIFVMTVTYYPFIFLLCHGAFESANPLLEEAGMIMGASRFRIFRRITLPLIIPSIGAGAIIVFIRVIGNFGIPAIIGGDQYVLPTLIYFQVSGFWDINGAASISLVSVLVTTLALILQKYIVSRRQYETLSASRSVHHLHTHPLARLFSALFVFLVLLVSLAPQLTMLIMSFFTSWYGLLPKGFTLQNYLRIPQIASKTIQNSLFLSSLATLIAGILGCIIAYITERRKPKGAFILDMAVMAPFILPGTVVSVAIISAFAGVPFALGGTYTIIIIAYVVRRTPYVYRSVVASLTQLNPALEEASWISGASWFYTFRRVSLPLILPAVLTGMILTFTTLLQELSTTILLYSAKTRTVPIQIYGAVADGKFGEASALSVLLIVTVFIIVYLANRWRGKNFAAGLRIG